MTEKGAYGIRLRQITFLRGVFFFFDLMRDA